MAEKEHLVGDLQEQISDLKHLLRSVANALERSLRASGRNALAVVVKDAIMNHHEFCTAHLQSRAREARAVINKASDCEGGPHIEDLEDRFGMHLPGR